MGSSWLLSCSGSGLAPRCKVGSARTDFFCIYYLTVEPAIDVDVLYTHTTDNTGLFSPLFPFSSLKGYFPPFSLTAGIHIPGLARAFPRYKGKQGEGERKRRPRCLTLAEYILPQELEAPCETKWVAWRIIDTLGDAAPPWRIVALFCRICEMVEAVPG